MSYPPNSFYFSMNGTTTTTSTPGGANTGIVNNGPPPSHMNTSDPNSIVLSSHHHHHQHQLHNSNNNTTSTPPTATATGNSSGGGGGHVIGTHHHHHVQPHHHPQHHHHHHPAHMNTPPITYHQYQQAPASLTATQVPAHNPQYHHPQQQQQQIRYQPHPQQQPTVIPAAAAAQHHQYRPHHSQQQQQPSYIQPQVQTAPSPQGLKYEYPYPQQTTIDQGYSGSVDLTQTSTPGGQSPASQQAQLDAKKGKKKSSIACELCRKHHRKCDGNQPCKNCSDKGVECVYTKRKKRGPKNDAAKKMREELEIMKKENETLKQAEEDWKKKFLELAEQESSSDPTNPNGKRRRIENDSRRSEIDQFIGQTVSILSTEASKTSYERQVHAEEEKRRYDERLVQSGLTEKHERFYLVNIVSKFVEIYDSCIHPDHSLLPPNPQDYSGIIPDLLSDMIQNKPRTPETNLFMYSLLCNSACCIGNLDLSKDFFQMARRYAGDTFDVMDYRVGCSFVLLSYYSMCQAEFTLALHYISIAKMIAEEGLKAYKSDLRQNALVGLAYSTNSYERRMELFKEIGKGDATGDQIFCLVGQVETELLFNKNPNWTPLIDMLMQAYNLQKNGPDENPSSSILHRVLTFGGLTKTLKKAKLPDMALHYAQELLKLLDDKNFIYCCVGVSSSALEAVADVLLEQGFLKDFRKVLDMLDLLSGRYKLMEIVRDSVFQKFNEMHPEEAKQYLAECAASSNNDRNSPASTTDVQNEQLREENEIMIRQFRTQIPGVLNSSPSSYQGQQQQHQQY